MIKSITKLKASLCLLFIFLFNFSFSQNMEKFNIEDFDVQLRQDNKFGEIERAEEDIIDKTIYNWQNKFSLDEKENILKIINHLDFIYEGRYFSFLSYLNRLISDNLIGNTTIEKLMDYHYAYLLYY